MTSGSGKPETRKALGKGISALLGQRPGAGSGGAPAATGAPNAGDPSAVASGGAGGLGAGEAGVALDGRARQIPLEQIHPNPYQPRKTFHADRLNELTASIAESGVVQPILVRSSGGDRFEIVAGERRWRASRAAGLSTIPAIVQEVSNERLLEIALIENIQREDLNPMETAHAFEQLGRDLALTHEQIAQKTGKDRATITNFLRLLRLAPEVQGMVGEGSLTMGHAKALAGLDAAAQKKLAQRIVEQGLSVRAVEKIAKAAQELPAAKPAPPPIDPNTRAAVMEMERVLGTRVKIVEGARGAGRIEIEYYNAGDLQRLYKHLAGDESDD